MAITVPEGQSAPFETIDSKHHAGIIIITTAICMVITLVCLLIRMYVRLLLSPPLAFDDIILLGGTVTAIVESIIVFYSASIGFGTAITLLDDRRVSRIQNHIAASDVLYLVTLFLSRCCIVAIYSRLTPRRSHKNILWTTFAISTASIIISIFIVTVDCSVNKPWVTPGEHCVNLFPRWQFITAIDIITEVFLFLFSVGLVYGLQMPVRHKVVIMISFAARLPLIPLESLRLAAFHKFINSHNPTFDSIAHYVWTQVEMNYSLVACTVFCLRPFMNAVTTAYGTAGDENLEASSRSRSTPYGSGTMYGSGRHGKSHNQSQTGGGGGGDFALQSFGAASASGARHGYTHTQQGAFVPRGAPGSEGAETLVTTFPGSSGAPSQEDRDERGSVGSDGSTRMIIKKDVEYTVQTEPRRADDHY
ncbi:uncharacterized protein LDX57_010123 [Aspergillus melleus]|uniref:uncharacterized protein n=1 Tax=Aspergillus melleus TaxID=138277 RepID=UPI001E8D65A8|nr:uncharacterized protein LDX57_010123 [Aspergillus melleus]KAH8432486.1 hypothetical protein LDX57_010123 [Aspergillus melleus]